MFRVSVGQSRIDVRRGDNVLLLLICIFGHIYDSAISRDRELRVLSSEILAKGVGLGERFGGAGVEGV